MRVFVFLFAFLISSIAALNLDRHRLALRASLDSFDRKLLPRADKGSNKASSSKQPGRNSPPPSPHGSPPSSPHNSPSASPRSSRSGSPKHSGDSSPRTFGSIIQGSSESLGGAATSSSPRVSEERQIPFASLLQQWQKKSTENGAPAAPPRPASAGIASPRPVSPLRNTEPNRAAQQRAAAAPAQSGGRPPRSPLRDDKASTSGQANAKPPLSPQKGNKVSSSPQGGGRPSSNPLANPRTSMESTAGSSLPPLPDNKLKAHQRSSSSPSKVISPTNSQSSDSSSKSSGRVNPGPLSGSGASRSQRRVDRPAGGNQLPGGLPVSPGQHVADLLSNADVSTRVGSTSPNRLRAASSSLGERLGPSAQTSGLQRAQGMPPLPSQPLARQGTFATNKVPTKSAPGLKRSKSTSDLSRKPKKPGDVKFLPPETVAVISKLKGDKYPMGRPQKKTAGSPSLPVSTPAGPSSGAGSSSGAGPPSGRGGISPVAGPSSSRFPAESVASPRDSERASRQSMDSMQSSQKGKSMWNFGRPSKQSSGAGARDSKDSKSSKISKAVSNVWPFNRMSDSGRPSTDSHQSQGILSTSPFADVQTQRISLDSFSQSSSDRGHFITPPASNRGSPTQQSAQEPAAANGGFKPFHNALHNQQVRKAAGIDPLDVRPGSSRSRPQQASTSEIQPVPGTDRGHLGTASRVVPLATQNRLHSGSPPVPQVKKKGWVEKGVTAIGAQSFYGENNPGAVSNFVGGACAGAVTVLGVTIGATAIAGHAIAGPIITGAGITGALAVGVHKHINDVKNHASKEGIPVADMTNRGNAKTEGVRKAFSGAKEVMSRTGSRMLSAGTNGMRKAASYQSGLNRMNKSEDDD